MSPATIAEIRALRFLWRRSDDEYRREPLALTRELNATDAAAERMRTLRAGRGAA